MMGEWRMPERRRSTPPFVLKSDRLLSARNIVNVLRNA